MAASKQRGGTAVRVGRRWLVRKGWMPAASEASERRRSVEQAADVFLLFQESGPLLLVSRMARCYCRADVPFLSPRAETDAMQCYTTSGSSGK